MVLEKAGDLGRIRPDPWQKVPGRDESRLDLVALFIEGTHRIYAGRPSANGEALRRGFHLVGRPPQQRAWPTGSQVSSSAATDP